jgi:hypothetical protein
VTAGVVMEADVQAARHLVDAWDETLPEGVTKLIPVARALLELRGMVATLAADARTAGYLEGLQAGRRQAGQLVRDALEGEGL